MGVKGRLLAVLLVASALLPQGAGAQDVPEIYLYANDFVGVLTYDEVATLDEICYQLDQVTSDEVAIVIVNSTLPLGIDIFAVELFQTSGIGKEDLDNGVLLLVSTEEEMWRIEVGYGLEGILNDAKVGSIGRESLEPYLAVQDYYPGIFYTVAALVEELTADPDRINWAASSRGAGSAGEGRAAEGRRGGSERVRPRRAQGCPWRRRSRPRGARNSAR